jgi:large subunit ribosomal protein L10
MPTPQKEATVAAAAQKVADSAGFYLLSFSGLSVADMDHLRGEVLKAGGNLQVIKNRLLKLALGEELSNKLAEALLGPTIVAFCAEDPVGPAQVLSRFADNHPGLALKAGYVQGRVLSAAEALKIATLPPRQFILAEALGVLAAPISGLVGVLNAAIGELVYVMEAQVEKQGAAA